MRTYESEFVDQTNNWLEDKLSEILNKRHTTDIELPDKEMLLLFRLLALKFRVHYPIKGQHLRMEPAFKVFLETWIIAAALEYFILY